VRRDAMTSMSTAARIFLVATAAILLCGVGTSLVAAQGQRQAPGPFGNEEFITQLAQELGVPPEQLRGAVQRTAQRMQGQPQQAVRPPEMIVRAAVVVLGMEPQVLQQHLQQGKSLADIAAEQGIDADSFADQLTQAAERIRVQEMRQQIRRVIEQPLVP
jgi:transposase-like protein